MKAAIYVRLSREDEDKIYETDSRSIENQIKALSDYANANSFEVVKVYVDDGVSGVVNDRPGLNEMLKGAKNKLFSTLLIKDLSRLGRRLHHVGTLIEETLPNLGIRIISVMDNYDSSNHKETDSIVLKNFLNDYYYKDIRNKCRKSLEYRANNKHINYYPKYGYLLDQDRKESIDPYASSIVKKIFVMAQTMNMSEIARVLNEEDVLTRSKYQKEVLNINPVNKISSEKWSCGAVSLVLKDYEYCGHTVNLLKRKEGPIILKDTRIAIVTEEEYALANLPSIKRKEYYNSRVNKLDFIYTEDGKKLLYKKRSKTNKYMYEKNGVRILEEHLIKILINDINITLNQIKEDKESFYQILKERILKKNSKLSKKEINDNLKKLHLSYSKLLENSFLNNITTEEFEFESEKINNKINCYNEELKKSDDIEVELVLLERKFNMFISNLKEEYSNDIELIRSVINRVKIYTNNDIEIIYKYE